MTLQKKPRKCLDHVEKPQHFLNIGEDNPNKLHKNKPLILHLNAQISFGITYVYRAF
jgi:hypothetical protein